MVSNEIGNQSSAILRSSLKFLNTVTSVLSSQHILSPFILKMAPPLSAESCHPYVTLKAHGTMGCKHVLSLSHSAQAQAGSAHLSKAGQTDLCA